MTIKVRRDGDEKAVASFVDPIHTESDTVEQSDRLKDSGQKLVSVDRRMPEDILGVDSAYETSRIRDDQPVPV